MREHEQLRLMAEIYVDADKLRRQAVVENEAEAARIFLKTSVSISKVAFDKGHSLDDFLAEVNQYEEESK